MKQLFWPIAPLVLAIAACAPGEFSGEVPIEVRIANADRAVTVTAAGETEPVGTVADDAADDPAIWRNPVDPAASLIVGTDKKAGLYVYALDGARRSFRNAGLVNNVDLRPGIQINGHDGILVVASDRNDLASARLALFELDPERATLRPLGTVPAGQGEAYGLCLYRSGVTLHAFLVLKDGTIRQLRLDTSGPVPSATLVRTLKLAGQSEGCAVDERTARLYVGEEARGVWRFDAGPEGAVTGSLIARADSKRLVADVEGIAVAPAGDRGGYLLVSSQGDNAYAVWRLADESYVGRFRVAPGALGGTEETDGIELMLGDFGPRFPGGLLVVQDGVNAPAAQNFKLVDWRAVESALGVAP